MRVDARDNGDGAAALPTSLNSVRPCGWPNLSRINYRSSSGPGLCVSPKLAPSPSSRAVDGSTMPALPYEYLIATESRATKSWEFTIDRRECTTTFGPQA